MMKSLILTIFFLFIPFLVIGGNIEYPNSFAWNDILGWIDLCLNQGHNCYNNILNTVTVGINSLSGFASSSVGFISFNCQDISACSQSNYMVYKTPTTTSSTLSGFAWNDVIGWISFNCEDLGVCPTSSYKVWIDSDGKFHGFAWNDMVGWISFNCQDIDYCNSLNYFVKTSFVAYASEGYLISSIFDTGYSSGVAYNSLIWEGELNGGVVKFQLATANTSSGPWNFVGPDCTSGSFYTAVNDNQKVFALCQQHYGQRYFRYKIILYPSADLSRTPIIRKVIINYSP